MSKPKYKQGKQICSISQFDACESEWYKWDGKTTHRSVLISLQYRTLKNAINAGRIYTAEMIDLKEGSENEQRLIDANALKESIDCSDSGEKMLISPRELHELLDSWIDHQPTIEPMSEWERDHELLKAYAAGQESVEHIMCEDCVYARPVKGDEGHRIDCAHGITAWEGTCTHGVNWYCADAERKKE